MHVTVELEVNSGQTMILTINRGDNFIEQAVAFTPMTFYVTSSSK